MEYFEPNKLKKMISQLSWDGEARSFTSEEKAYFSFYGLNPEDYSTDVEHLFGYLNCDMYRIACHYYRHLEACGSVFVLHGYFDHSGLFGNIVRFLLRNKLNVFIYDLPGHGLSSGDQVTIEGFSIYREVLESILDQCSQVLNKPWYAFAQSAGSAILTDFLNDKASQKIDLPFKQVILSAPLIRPYCWNMGRMQLYLLRPFVRKVSRAFTRNSRDKKFVRFAHSDPLAPKILPTQWVSALDRWIQRIESSQTVIPLNPLIIQGTKDRTVDAKHNIVVLKRLFRMPEVLWLDNARHHLPNELIETQELYMKWLTKAFQEK